MVMLVNLDTTIVNIALPTIAHTFKATLGQGQWIITSYLLATALTFTLFGRLADIYGRKKIFLLGVFCFTFGSFLAGFSVNLLLLLFSRFIQGVGFAATLGLAFVLIFSTFPQNQRGRAAGYMVSITGISQVIGPTIGGLITQYCGWSWIFWFNVPFGILSFYLTVKLVKQDSLPESNRKIDLLNTSLFIMGLGLILYAFNELLDLRPLSLLILFVLGLLFLVKFIHTSFRSKNPLIKTNLLLHRRFASLAVLRFFMMMVMSSALLIMPLYLQNILNYSPAMTGIILLGMTLFIAISSPLTGKIIDNIGFVLPTVLSVFLALLACLSTFFLTTTTTIPVIIMILFPLGLAIGIHIPSTISGISSETSAEDAGTGMGLFFTLAISGSTIGVAIAGVSLRYFSKLSLLAKINPKDVTALLLKGASGIHNIHQLSPKLQIIVANSFIHAYHSFMLIMTSLMIIATLLAVYFLKNYSAR